MAEGMSWASERFHNRKGGLWSGISILHILFASCLATHNDGQQREISVTFRNTLRNTIPRPTAEREWSRESPAWRDRYQSFVFPRLLCPLFLLIFAELPLLKPINMYADLLDFHKNWPECSWDINKPKYARRNENEKLNENFKYFSREVPELDNNRTILFCQTSK